MNRTEFVTATALVLFAAFVLGWFACWLIGRLTRPSHADLDALKHRLQRTERDRDHALATLAERERDLSGRLAAAESDRDAAMDGLRESRAEIEDLRDYIERTRTRR